MVPTKLTPQQRLVAALLKAMRPQINDALDKAQAGADGATMHAHTAVTTLQQQATDLLGKGGEKADTLLAYAKTWAWGLVKQAGGALDGLVTAVKAKIDALITGVRDKLKAL